MINVLLSTYLFHENWIRHELEPYIHSETKVVIVPFAFKKEWVSGIGDWNLAYSKNEGKYYNEIVKPFKTFGVTEENITWLNYYLDSKETMIDKIEASNLIFFTGGLPEQAIMRIDELGLETTIKNCNKPIIGASAGALMQLPNYFISPDEDYECFGYYKGLGLINQTFNIEVHYEGLEAQDEAIKQCIKDKRTTVYAIKDRGGIIMKQGKMKLVGEVIQFN